MSDIDLSNLDWIIWTFVVCCFIGPPLVLGGVFLLLDLFIRQKRVLLGIYLLTSTVVSGVILDRLSDWQNWPEVGTWAFPIGLGMAIGCYGLLIFFRWLRKKMRNKSRSS